VNLETQAQYGRPRHKFKAVRTERDGIKFPSKREAEYYDELKLKVKAGLVAFFIRQVPFHLPGNIKYVCDFLEFHADGTAHFVDVKGKRTKEYIRNKKMVEALYPIEIEEK
jgi:hypothetical protein